MAYEIVTPAGSEPITLTEAKNYLRVDHSEDDALITTCIQAAREIVEERTNRKMLPTVIKQYHDTFPCTIELRWSPATVLTSVKYYDVDDVEQTMSASDYYVDLNAEPATISPKTTWPSIYDRKNAVTVQYTAGYADADNVKAMLKKTMFLLLEEMYDMRENTVKKLPTAADHWITQSKVFL